MDTLMSSAGQLLKSLRDVQEPPPPESVPLWLPGLNLLLFIMILLLGWHLFRRWKSDWRKRVISDLHQAQTLPPSKAIISAATVLRQLMIALGKPAHTVHGQQWLELLDEQFDTHWFTREEGRLLGDSLYRSDEIDKATITAILVKLEDLVTDLPAQAIRNPERT